MRVIDTTVPQDTFGDLDPSDGFIAGAGHPANGAACVKTDDGGCTRLDSGQHFTADQVPDTAVVTFAPDAEVSMFPPPPAV